MTTKSLLESATLIEAPPEGPWKIRIISEGKGTSGIYSPELLESYHQAFNDTLSFENHPTGWDGPESRNFLQIVGKIVGETWVDTDERGKRVIDANWEPDPDHRERLSRYKKNLGMSIYIEGDGHVDDDGEFVIDSFNEHDPYKSVDVVLAAGRGGKFMESMRSVYDNRRSANTDTIVEEHKSTEANRDSERKDNKMDEKVLEALEALTTQVSALVSSNTAKVEQESQAEANEEAVKEALKSIQASVDAVEAERENLSTKQVESLRAKAFAGEDVTDLIAEAKETREAILAEATDKEDEPTTGRVLGEGAAKSAADLGKVFG